MNRNDERMALIEQLRRENAAMISDMAARRQRLGDEAFEQQPVVRRDYWPRQQRPHQQQPTAEQIAVAKMVSQQHAQQDGGDPDHLVSFATLTALSDEVGMVTGRLERVIKQNRAAQDDALTTVFARLDDLEARLDLLEADVIEALNRSGNVAQLNVA